MGEAKFTPGPWSVDAGFETSRPGDFDEYWQVHDGKDAIACSAYCYAGNRKANAHLIAAAPELYEVLDDIATAAHNGFNIHQNSVLIAEARAALAKARGEMP